MRTRASFYKFKSSACIIFGKDSLRPIRWQMPMVAVHVETRSQRDTEKQERLGGQALVFVRTVFPKQQSLQKAGPQGPKNLALKEPTFPVLPSYKGAFRESLTPKPHHNRSVGNMNLISSPIAKIPHYVCAYSSQSEIT